MKCDKTIDSLDRMAESTMRWLEGEEVTAILDWDDRYYYVGFEPTSGFEDFAEEMGGHLLTMLADLRQELEKIGVNRFYDLDSVNEFCEQYCGDNEPSMFYVDDTFGWVCGA